LARNRVDRYAGPVAALALAFASGAWSQPADSESEVLPIDLPTALRLADERNLDIAIYVERIAEASARLAQARTRAVPTLRAGATHDRHSGNIQETGGQVLDVDRASQFTGIGAGLAVDVADAVFAPLVARQNQVAVAAASTANRHLVLLEVASAYLRLLQSREETNIAQRALDRALDLATLTADYAEAGQGLLADAEMAAVQPLLWEQRRLIAVERTEAAAAELARLLHLDANVELEPLENEIPVLEIFSGNEGVEALVSRALLDRPEAEQYDALVAAAEDDLNAQRYGLFIPSVGLDYRVGQFGGAPGSSIENRDDRDDLTLSLYWQFDNFGFGHRARTNEKRAQLREVSLERDKLRDGIAAEVRAGHSRVRSFAGQLEFAESAVARAEQAYRLNRERIFDQQGLPLEALQAMQMLAAAELADLDARVGHALAEVRLHTVLGSPIDSEFP
jgi:outer membrane protein TolC